VNDISNLASDIYWVDRHSGHLHWTNKFNSIARAKKMDVGLNRDVDQPHLVAVRGKRVASTHPCQENNGNCSHVCLALAKSAVSGSPPLELLALRVPLMRRLVRRFACVLMVSLCATTTARASLPSPALRLSLNANRTTPAFPKSRSEF